MRGVRKALILIALSLGSEGTEVGGVCWVRGVRAATSEGLAGIERAVLLGRAGLCCFLRRENELVLTDCCLRAAAVCLVGGGSLELSGTYLILSSQYCQYEVNEVDGTWVY